MPSSNVVTTPVTGSVLVKAGPCTLYGYSFLNAAIIYDGVDATGRIVVNEAGAETTPIMPNGIRMNTGIFVAAGAGAGSVWWG